MFSRDERREELDVDFVDIVAFDVGGGVVGVAGGLLPFEPDSMAPIAIMTRIVARMWR